MAVPTRQSNSPHRYKPGGLFCIRAEILGQVTYLTGFSRWELSKLSPEFAQRADGKDYEQN